MTIERRTIAGVRVSNLFDPPGKPLGWAHHVERDYIRAHLLRRGWQPAESRLRAERIEARITAIQYRLHRYDKTFRELQALYAAARPPAPARTAPFTAEELSRVVEHFAGANDPVIASIAAKAEALLNNA